MYTDDVWVGTSNTELTANTKSSMSNTVKTGSTLVLGQSAGESRLNAGAMKIGPAIGMYMPEPAMILGGQELL
jgi:hypothetical protein